MPDKVPAGHNDIVMANILAGPLQQLASTLLALLKPGGQLILSGILAEQAADVRRAYEPDIKFEVEQCRDGWVRLTGQRKV
jgi:ribosomal protein L11 methyltransferase